VTPGPGVSLRLDLAEAVHATRALAIGVAALMTHDPDFSSMRSLVIFA